MIVELRGRIELRGTEALEDVVSLLHNLKKNWHIDGIG